LLCPSRRDGNGHVADGSSVSPLLPHALGGGVSGGKESQGWRDFSHTAMVGAGKFGSAKLNGNGDVSRKAFALPVDCRTEMKGQRVATFGCPHPRRRLTGEGDLPAAEARL